VTDRLPRVAVDTSVILDLLLDQDPDRTERAKYLLDGHNTRHQIVLPAIVIAEIAGAPNVRSVSDDVSAAERDDRVKRALDWIMATQYIVIDLSERVAKRAAQLAVTHELKGADASVLASAELFNCARLYTRDGNLTKLNDQYPFPIIEPDELPEPEPEQGDLFVG